MEEDRSFEALWLEKFSSGLDGTAGEEVRKKVMAGSQKLLSQPGSSDTIDWTKQAMERLDALVEEDGRRDIMTGCACQYSKADLQEIRRAYEDTHDIAHVHQMLQAHFESFLKRTRTADETATQTVISRGWGLAGIRQGDTIIATKIPKSENLGKYMAETDPAKRRALYCHCPRVKDMLLTPETISMTYCYCGAGFYKGIWEEILQEPVRVELLTSVLRGDDVCSVRICLPGSA